MILPIDSEGVRKHAEIRYLLRNNPIGERDMVIAAVAAANELILITHNTREFSRIDGLILEDRVSEEH